MNVLLGWRLETKKLVVTFVVAKDGGDSIGPEPSSLYKLQRQV